MSLEKNWLDSLGESSKRIYERNWAYFKEFLKLNTEKELTTEEILESKRKDGNGEWKTHLMQFKQWIIEEKGLSPNTAKTAVGTVRGFFANYATPIYLTRSEKQRLDKGGRTTKDYKFSRKDIAKMVLVSNLEESYIILFGKSVGLRAGDFLKFTYGDFRQLDLESETPIYMGEFVTTKKAKIANCFIDNDSLPVIKALLEANTNKKDSDRIITVRSGELSVILQRIADKTKIQYGNARVRFHCLRKWLITRLSATMSESSWKQVVGKSISEDAYVSTDLLRTAYGNALKDLTVMSGNGNGHSAKVEMLEQAINQLETENSTSKTRIDLLQKTTTDFRQENQDLKTKLETMEKSIETANKNMIQLAEMVKRAVNEDMLRKPCKSKKIKDEHKRAFEK